MIGRLLYNSGLIEERIHEKTKREAQELGKESFQWAFHCDKHKDERERGISIHGSIKSYSTELYQYTIFDVGGHRDFRKCN